MKTILNFTVVFLLLVLSSGILMAQTCPQGKTAFIWVNGILVPDSGTWNKDVRGYEVKFKSSLTSRNLDPNCVKFVPVYNQSQGFRDDLKQSKGQIELDRLQGQLNDLANKAISDLNLLNLVGTFIRNTDRSVVQGDPDLKLVTDEIFNQWVAGYRVVLVGHSQGSLFVNEAYNIKYREALLATNTSTFFQPNTLQVINIAGVAHSVADGHNRYTTQCNDIIEYLSLLKYIPFSGFSASDDPLPWNVTDNSKRSCIDPGSVVVATVLGQIITQSDITGIFSGINLTEMRHAFDVHSLSDSYLLDNSTTQKQIFTQMADSLATVTTFGPTNSEDVWITNIYYGGGMDNNECRIGGWGDYYYCLFKFSLYGQPSIVDYAGLQFYKYAEGGNRSGIYSDRVTSSWTESTRWLNQPSAVNLSTLPPPVDGQWYTIDITSLYNGWQNGSYPNYGIRLRPTSVASDVHNTFRSSEYADANFRPRLVLKYVSSSPSPPPLNTVPTLTLSGANPLSLNVGAQFVEPGYTATDAEDGNITSRVVVSGSVNTAVAGTYTLTYSVTDNGGLSASKTRTVNVVATRVSGTTTITLTSANSTVVWLSSNYYGGGMQNAECRIGGWGDYYYCLIKFNISAPGSKIVLRLYKYVEGGSLSGIILDRVTSDWNGVTKWSAKPASVNITTLPQPVYGQWYEIDITSLYNGWQNGTFPNYGIMLRPTVNGPDVHNTFWSPLYSDATLRPQLVVTTATNSTPPVVQPPPLPSFTGSCAVNGSLNPITLQAGNTAYYGAGYNNIGAVHFFWTGASGGDVSSASQIYNYAGVYNASVMMTDSASPPRQITVNCPQVTVSAPPPPPSPVPFATSCYITPSLIKLGASATYTANASGGYSPYIFNLPGMVYSTSPFNQLTTITPGNIGTQVYQGFVQDSSGQVLKPTCSVTVTK